MAGIEEIQERRRIEPELQEKSAIPPTVSRALHAFLESEDWNAASQHLLNFALKQTRSEHGILGLRRVGPKLRVLAHNGKPCKEGREFDLHGNKWKQNVDNGYFQAD